MNEIIRAVLGVMTFVAVVGTIVIFGLALYLGLKWKYGKGGKENNQ